MPGFAEAARLAREEGEQEARWWTIGKDFTVDDLAKKMENGSFKVNDVYKMGSRESM